VKYLTDSGQGWQIHREIISGEDRSVARVLLGSDGVSAATGGDYRKSAYLWGVRQDLVEDGLTWLSRGYDVALRVWAERNLGRDVGLHVGWLFPKPDEDARREAYAQRCRDYSGTLVAYRAAGLEVTQTLADELAAAFGVPPARLTSSAPALAEERTSVLTATGTDLDGWRVALGLPKVLETDERKRERILDRIRQVTGSVALLGTRG
jgi:hypothetical protein